MSTAVKKTTEAASVKKPSEPVPATPRRRVVQARGLTTISASIRDAIAGCVDKALRVYALAQIAVLQDDSNFREEAPRFDNDADDAPARPWQTFENLISDDPNKAVTAPVTIATDVKMGLASLFIAVADLINSVGKLPIVDPLSALTASPAREANIVQLMMAVTQQMRPHLRADPMNRDIEFPMVFRRKLEAIVTAKSLVDPGAETVARLYLDFLKVVAWHAGTLAYEHEHLTLNRATLYAILAQQAASVPEGDIPVVRDVLSFVRAQVETWETAVAVAKAAKTKKAPLKKSTTPARAAAAKPVAAAKTPAAAKAAPPKATAAADAKVEAETKSVADVDSPNAQTQPEAATVAAAEAELITKDAPQQPASVEKNADTEDLDEENGTVEHPARPEAADAEQDGKEDQLPAPASPTAAKTTPPPAAKKSPTKQVAVAPELDYDTLLVSLHTEAENDDGTGGQ